LFVCYFASCSSTQQQTNTQTSEVGRKFHRVATFSATPQFDPECKSKNPNANTLDLINKCMSPGWKKVLSEQIPKEQLRAQLANKTSIHFSSQHGTQVSFYAADGKTYLWYPGNSAVLAGLWKATDETEVNGRPARQGRAPADYVCFKYPTNSYNPVTKRGGGTWNCARGGELLYLDDRNVQEGDVYGLSSRGPVPFITQRGRKYSATQLKNNS